RQRQGRAPRPPQVAGRRLRLPALRRLTAGPYAAAPIHAYGPAPRGASRPHGQRQAWMLLTCPASSPSDRRRARPGLCARHAVRPPAAPSTTVAWSRPLDSGRDREIVYGTAEPHAPPAAADAAASVPYG